MSSGLDKLLNKQDKKTLIKLLKLPDHLKETMLALLKVGVAANSEQVAKESGRVRNIESSYLNELVRLGYAEKQRKGMKVYFTLKREE